MRRDGVLVDGDLTWDSSSRVRMETTIRLVTC